jgi:hypothetical protein
LASPFAAARFAWAWAGALPGSPAPGGAFPWAASGTEARAAAEAARERADAVRKGAKALRDRVCARLAALGQSVGGLPQEPRAALDALDQNLPWPRKLEAQADLEALLLRLGAKAVPAKTAGGSAPAGPAGPDPRLKDLSGRFRKL